MLPPSKKNFIFTIVLYLFFLGLIYLFLSRTGKSIPWAPEVNAKQRQEYKQHAQKYLAESEDIAIKDPRPSSSLPINNYSTNRERIPPPRNPFGRAKEKLYKITVTTDMKGDLWIDETKMEVNPLAEVEVEVPANFSYYFVSADELFKSDDLREKIRPDEREDFKLPLKFKTAYNDYIKDKDLAKAKKQRFDKLAANMVPISNGSYTFEISKFEVTVGEFAKFIRESNYRYNKTQRYIRNFSTGRLISLEKKNVNWEYNPIGKKYEETQYNFPVVNVSWQDAVAYCNWLTENNDKYKYRLPSIVEWNLAAYGKNKNSKYPWGKDAAIFNSYANIADKTLKDAYGIEKIKETQEDHYVLCNPINKFKPTVNGLHNMFGNVAEWCEEQVHIGGSHATPLKACVKKEGYSLSAESHPSVGFRISRVPK